jgi:phosphopantothenoylcysteine decarboxylase/phosphopantothenate--cysteine ligase
LLVGFAVETGTVAELLAEARRKLTTKNTDLIIGNLAQDSFDRDTNRVWIVNQNGAVQEVETASKARVSRRILDAVVSLEALNCPHERVQH